MLNMPAKGILLNLLNISKDYITFSQVLRLFKSFYLLHLFTLWRIWDDRAAKLSLEWRFKVTHGVRQTSNKFIGRVGKIFKILPKPLE